MLVSGSLQNTWRRKPQLGKPCRSRTSSLVLLLLHAYEYRSSNAVRFNEPIGILLSVFSSILLLHPLCALVVENSPRPSAAMLQAFGDGIPILWSERPIRHAD